MLMTRLALGYTCDEMRELVKSWLDTFGYAQRVRAYRRLCCFFNFNDDLLEMFLAGEYEPDAWQVRQLKKLLEI